MAALGKLRKGSVPLWMLLAVLIASGAMLGAAVMLVYTKVPTTFEVEKSIVVDGETYINGTYSLPIDLGTLCQGENATTTIKVTNNANRPLTIDADCGSVKLVYKSGYTLTKDKANASKDWGISITLTPGGKLTLPAKTMIQITITVSVGVNATVANSQDPKYDHFEAGIEICPDA